MPQQRLVPPLPVRSRTGGWGVGCISSSATPRYSCRPLDFSELHTTSLPSSHLVSLPATFQHCFCLTLYSSCSAGRYLTREFTETTQPTQWLPSSSSAAAMTCPRWASASGRSTTPLPRMSFTTPSRPATASSTAPAVSRPCPPSPPHIPSRHPYRQEKKKQLCGPTR
jgi:hypothetical protein